MRTDGPSLTARIVAVHRAELDRPSTPTGDPDGDDRLCVDLIEGFGDARDGVFGWVSARTRFFDAEILRRSGPTCPPGGHPRRRL